MKSDIEEMARWTELTADLRELSAAVGQLCRNAPEMHHQAAAFKILQAVNYTRALADQNITNIAQSMSRSASIDPSSCYAHDRT